MVVIELLVVTFIMVSFGILFIKWYLLNEPTICKTCGTRFRRHGYDQLLQCPNWAKKDHTGQEEWYCN